MEGIAALKPRPLIAMTTNGVGLDRLTDVEKGLKAAASAGLTPVKVNAVAMRGINDHSAADVLQWCLDCDYEGPRNWQV